MAGGHTLCLRAKIHSRPELPPARALPQTSSAARTAIAPAQVESVLMRLGHVSIVFLTSDGCNVPVHFRVRHAGWYQRAGGYEIFKCGYRGNSKLETIDSCINNILSRRLRRTVGAPAFKPG